LGSVSQTCGRALWAERANTDWDRFTKSLWLKTGRAEGHPVALYGGGRKNSQRGVKTIDAYHSSLRSATSSPRSSLEQSNSVKQGKRSRLPSRSAPQEQRSGAITQGVKTHRCREDSNRELMTKEEGRKTLYWRRTVELELLEELSGGGGQKR